MSDPNRKLEKQRQKQEAEARYQAEIAALPPFQEWPKIARLNRDIVITEKIDGTNAAVGIVEYDCFVDHAEGMPAVAPSKLYSVYAQSRSRIVTPSNDNMGFAAWAEKHKDVLIKTLGPGLHFGEWWGCGIQRGYGLSERRFSLFNTVRWNTPENQLLLSAARSEGCAIYSVPVLYEGPWRAQEFEPMVTDWTIANLRHGGSCAVPGYIRPEGIVIFHKASGQCFKVTLEKDESHKSDERVLSVLP